MDKAALAAVPKKAPAADKSKPAAKDKPVAPAAAKK